MARQLKAMGADIDEHDDGLTIRGGRPLGGYPSTAKLITAWP